jgi:enediyne biosynthesis protein E4
VETNQTITVRYRMPGKTGAISPEPPLSYLLFEEITEQLGISYIHEENSFIEFNREALIPHMVSSEGPPVAIGDVTGNGLDDIFAGGARHQFGVLFTPARKRTF